MARREPEVGQILIQCLEALSVSEAHSMAKVRQTAHLGKSYRNFVSDILRILESLGLVTETLSKGSSKMFLLTPRAHVFLSILKQDYHRLAREIGEVKLALKNYAPRHIDDPNEIERFLITSRIENDVISSPYSKLNVMADAFSLATNALDSDSPEHQVSEDISTLLKSSSSDLLSEDKKDREEGKSLLKEAERILDSVATAKKMADDLGLASKHWSFKEVGKDGRGKPIYQVRSSG